MQLSGAQIKQLRQALLSAFPEFGLLEFLVETELEENLAAITGATDLSTVVFKLILWARSQGRLAELVEKAYRENPRNPELRAFAEPFFGPVIISPTDRRNAVNAQPEQLEFKSVGAPRHPVQEAYNLLNMGMEQISHFLSMGDVNQSPTNSEYVWNQRVDAARDLLRAGQHRAAFPLLAKLRDEADQSLPPPAIRSRIANNLGVSALGTGELDEAEGYFKEALTYDPGSAKALANQAMVNIMKGNFEQALLLSTQAWNAETKDPIVLGVHIQALHRANRTSDAEQLIHDNAWVMERDEFAPAIAAIWYNLGRYQEAETLIRRALQSSPHDAQFYTLLAGLIFKPIQDELMNADGPVEKLPATVVIRLEEAEQAYSQARQLFEQHGNGHAQRMVLVSRSGIRFLLGRGEEGLYDCEQVLREEPLHISALENKGRILLAAGRAAEATVCFESIVNQINASATTSHYPCTFHAASRSIISCGILPF